MFTFAILLGIYSYIIFALGLTGLLHKELINLFSILFIFFVVFLFFRKFNFQLRKDVLKDKIILLFGSLFFLQVFVNLIGVLGPELSFDALWYHLTLPKIYLMNNSIQHIPGGLLYYSDMPKLGEMLYTGALAFGNEILVKGIHFFFGILTSIALYQLARRFMSQQTALIAVVIFYTNIVVAWQSTTAYIDLIRTFFEVLALASFMQWVTFQKNRWLYISAIMTGLAVTTKLLAFGTAVILTILIIYILKTKKLSVSSIVKRILFYWSIVLLIPLPWFIFAAINTGNPIYPFFSDIYHVKPEPLLVTKFFQDFIQLFIKADDPISPIYIILLPLIAFTYSQFKRETKLLVWFSLLAIVMWYFTPRTGGGRFIVPYLPVISLVCAAALDVLMRQKKKYVNVVPFIILLLTVISFITIGYRTAASMKYVPVVLGKESKDEFLSNNLNFSYGDFYDTDNYFKENIKSNDVVLLYGFHNLYYMNFNFIDSSWAKKGDTFTYIAVQKNSLPEEYKDWQLIYANDKTMVKLYRHNYKKVSTF